LKSASRRIEKKFKELGSSTALIPFITAGHPSIEATYNIVLTLEKNGADIIELGIPFSDPLADGPTIQKSSQHALDTGVTPGKVLDMVREIRQKSQVPLIFMVYYNIILQMGEEKFIEEAVSAGIDGIIVPDLPLEEADSLRKYAEDGGVDLIFLLAPTSTNERIKALCSASRGFVYYVSLTGVTGTRSSLAVSIQEKVEAIKSNTKLPVCVGFGISTPEQAKAVSKHADGVIVGSALVEKIEKSGGNLEDIGNFIKSIKTVLAV